MSTTFVKHREWSKAVGDYIETQSIPCLPKQIRCTVAQISFLPLSKADCDW